MSTACAPLEDGAIIIYTYSRESGVPLATIRIFGSDC